MASPIRASIIIRGLAGFGKPAIRQRPIASCYQQQFLPKRYASAAATPAATSNTTIPASPTTTTPILPDNIKWEATGTTSEQLTGGVTLEKAADILGGPEITGAIIPFSQQNIAQNLFFPYQYPIMHYMDLLLNFSPWWLTIVATTATVRLVFFPLVLKMNIIGIKIFNLMPETQAIQVKLNEAIMSGNAYETAIAKTKLKLLYEQHDVKIMQRLWPTLIQSPAFLCLFFTLKNLAGYWKLPAMAVGGALWFTNLTLPDPYYILPAMTSLSMFLLLEYGLEGSSGPISTMGPIGRWMIRALPAGLFLVFQSFPAAVLLFWTTNNFFTLGYAILLRQAWIKRKLKIPERLVHDPATLPLTNQSFMGQISKSVDKAKGHRTTLDLRRLDDVAFMKAGVGPLRKTYKSPPIKES